MFRILFIAVLLLFSLSVVSSDHAYAQRKGEVSVKDKIDEAAEYENMILSGYEYTSADFQLMNGFYHRCMRDGTNMSYNCECLANKYINKKIVYADTITDYQIHMETSKDCVDITAVAGLAYTECSKLGDSDPRWSEEYCECYANTYAKIFAKAGGNMTRIGKQNARIDVMGECNFEMIDVAKAEEDRKSLAAKLQAQARARLQ